MIGRHPGECKPHAYQDAVYGRNVRVLNPSVKGGKTLGARCTVCCPPKEKGKARGGIFAIDAITIVRK